MLQMARKQPESLLDLHDLFREVWEGRDKSLDPPRKAELGPGPLLAHSEDILHPENLVTASRNFPTQAAVSLAKLEAARLLRQGRTPNLRRRSREKLTNRNSRSSCGFPLRDCRVDFKDK